MLESSFFEYLNEHGYSYSCNEPMRKHTSFGIGGAADVFARPVSIAQLCSLIRLLKTTGIPYHILGRGTNLLYPDAGYSGCVISTEHLAQIEVKNSLIRAECGASLHSIAKVAAENGLIGWSGIAGIPASLGGAVRTNAAAFGNAVSDHLIDVGVYDAEKDVVHNLSKAALAFGYRRSLLLLSPHLTVLWGIFRFPIGNTEEEWERYRHVGELRRARQPIGASAGSVFRNPQGLAAGKMLEDVGLKGHRIGGAEISKKHANIIVNTGGATYEDVTSLIALARDRVYRKFGVFLTPEIERMRIE